MEVQLTKPWSRALLAAQGQVLLKQTRGEAQRAASVVGALPTVLEEVACLLIFNTEETDPFCKMRMSHRSYIIAGRESEPVFKAHGPYSGNVFRDCRNEPFTVILDL